MGRFYNCLVAESRFMQKLYGEVAEEASTFLGRGTVLDVGTGPGSLPVQLARRMPGISVVGLDLSPDMISTARGKAEKERLSDRLTYVVEDAVQMSFEDASFDLVVSTASFHHWTAPVGIFNEIHRVLRDGGEAWIYDLRGDAQQYLKQKLREAGYGRLLTFLVTTGLSRHSGVSPARLETILGADGNRFKEYRLEAIWRGYPFLKASLIKG